ncbi:hypothetical protein [uncultured Methanobrevibacter sp.]|uniref:hypothetical protein n=1 Tax=uncultured Methanobrevibacter sp. TaxID=253161 RepID=UPI0025F91E78|nr:hypothetical protein [uncultured Methanobrevibacter sp.]
MIYIQEFKRFVNENLRDSSFKETVKYTKSDFENWKKEIKNNKDIVIDHNSVEKIWLIYINDKHVGTYNEKTQILMCDDIKLFGNVVENLDEAIKYKPEDFNLDNAPKELVQYIIDNIDDFGKRYQKAITKMDRQRCPFRIADNVLYNEINDRISDWCSDNDEDEDDYDVEEIFGF